MGHSTLYDRDYWQWTQEQIQSLQKGHWVTLDIDNLVEELETLGRSEQREIGSYLQVLIMHLLKCEYQPEKRTTSWNQTLNHCRNKIQDCLEDTPSLQGFLVESEWLEKYYRRARRDAAEETNQALTIFPENCPYTIEQILDPEFLRDISQF
jgi:acyl carrier protein phosphodiesterase